MVGQDRTLLKNSETDGQLQASSVNHQDRQNRTLRRSLQVTCSDAACCSLLVLPQCKVPSDNLMSEQISFYRQIFAADGNASRFAFDVGSEQKSEELRKTLR